jgi:hypothetical protein
LSFFPLFGFGGSGFIFKGDNKDCRKTDLEMVGGVVGAMSFGCGSIVEGGEEEKLTGI